MISPIERVFLLLSRASDRALRLAYVQLIVTSSSPYDDMSIDVYRRLLTAEMARRFVKADLEASTLGER